MKYDNNDVSTAGACLAHGCPDVWQNRANGDATAHVVAIPHVHARCRSSDDRHTSPGALDHRPRAVPPRAIDAVRICREKRKPRLGYGAVEKRHPIVEFMIADRRGV